MCRSSRSHSPLSLFDSLFLVNMQRFFFSPLCNVLLPLPEHCPNVCPGLQPLSVAGASTGCNPTTHWMHMQTIWLCIHLHPIALFSAAHRLEGMKTLATAREGTCLRSNGSAGIWTRPIDLFMVSSSLNGASNRMAKYLSRRSAVVAGDNTQAADGVRRRGGRLTGLYVSNRGERERDCCRKACRGSPPLSTRGSC